MIVHIDVVSNTKSKWTRSYVVGAARSQRGNVPAPELVRYSVILVRRTHCATDGCTYAEERLRPRELVLSLFLLRRQCVASLCSCCNQYLFPEVSALSAGRHIFTSSLHDVATFSSTGAEKRVCVCGRRRRTKSSSAVKFVRMRNENLI